MSSNKNNFLTGVLPKRGSSTRVGNLEVPSGIKMFAKRNSSNCVDSLETLSKILTYLGISNSKVLNSDKFPLTKTSCKYLYPFLLHISTIDWIVTMLISFGVDAYAESSAYIFEIILSVSMWYSLFAKRESLQSLLRRVQQLSKPNHDYLKHLLFINMILLTVNALSILYTSMIHQDSKACGFYYYQMNISCDFSFPKAVFLAVKAFMLSVVNPFMCKFTCLLFCVVCHRCSKLLRNFRRKVDDVILMESFTFLQPELYNRYCKIITSVRQVQEVFSLTCLLIFMHNYVEAFMLLGVALRGSPVYVSDLFYYSCISIPSCILCILVPACAAKVSVEMRKNRETFSSLCEKLAFRPGFEPLNLKVAKCLRQVDPITLSAWDMIGFSSGVVPSIIGWLLTYGLLLLNLDK